jgi:Fe-S cluster assembly protein SufD
MPTLLEKPAPTEDDTVSNALLLDGPIPEPTHSAWRQSFHAKGWTQFQELPMPQRKDEKWRFANTTFLALEGYRQNLPIPHETRGRILAASVSSRPTAAVFANETLLQQGDLPEDLKKKGVLWMTLETAFAQHEDLLKKYLLTQEITLGSKKFAALHQAYCRNGVLLFVPKGVEIETPLDVWFWLTGENASAFPHVLIIAETNSKVTVVEHRCSWENQPGFACSVSDVFAGPGAQVTYVTSQDWSPQALSVHLNVIAAEKDSNVQTLQLNLGGRYSRAESKSRLLGAGARSEMLSLTISQDKQQFDQRTFQDHVSPNTFSDLLYKNALSDESRTIFAGMIRVEPHAQGVDAYQSNRNLLLDGTAEANALPGLEILANDVRCTHGATTGQVEEEQMFYLESRGLKPLIAKQLLVFGFFEEVLNRLKNPDIHEELSALIRRKFVLKPKI